MELFKAVPAGYFELFTLFEQCFKFVGNPKSGKNQSLPVNRPWGAQPRVLPA
jgi:hypothetical protein